MPLGLRATTVRSRGEHVLVLSYPLPCPVMPGALTAAEREVLGGLLAGEVSGDLAKLRGTSPRTVANQIGSIFRKLGVSSRAELLALLHTAAKG